MAQQRTRRRNGERDSRRRSSRQSGRLKSTSSRRPKSQDAPREQRRRRANAYEKSIHTEAPQGSRRIDALEGCRALAIIAIVLYHLSVPWLPSGHMGVVLFLVLSGYLATASILKVLRRSGGLSLPRLWLKRVVRIWPSMALMIVVTVAACALCQLLIADFVLLTKLRPDLIPSLLFANNIGAILRGASYFDNLGGTSPLTHLWYLGVDMQFFVVWSVLLAVLCPSGRPTRPARLTAIALAFVSALLMAILYDPNGDPTRVYYGTDTRAFAPLLGAWLGLAWPLGGRPVRLDAERHTVRSAPLALLGPLSLAALIVIMVFVPDRSAFLYRGGMLLVAILSVLFMAGLLDERMLLSRVLSLPPLTWLGERSFGIYLWHFPLFQIFRVTRNSTSPVLVILALVLSVVFAELSLRFVDNVIAQRRIPFIPSNASGRRGTSLSYLAWVPAGALALLLACGTTGLAVIPDRDAAPKDAIKSTGEGVAVAKDLSKEKREATVDDEEESSSNDSSSQSDKSSSKEKNSKKSSSKVSDDEPIVLKASSKSIKKGQYTPFIVADSVAGDADWCFKERMPDYYLDSYVGRLPSQALPVIEGYIEQEVVGNIVVLATFSNMPATDEEMSKLIKACGDREIYLVNARTLDVECEQINKTINKCAKKYDNVHVIDWHKLAVDEDDWFYPDGEHLTPEGQPKYVDLIAHEISQAVLDDGGSVEPLDEAEKDDYDGAGKSKVVDPTADN